MSNGIQSLFLSAQQQKKFKMKIFLQLASCFLVLHAATIEDPTLMEWHDFKTKFDKNYKTQEEEKFRMENFMEKRNLIAEHNAKYDRGEVTYKMGINKFSDMSHDELMNFYTGLKHVENPDTRTEETTFNFPADIPVPEYVNWVEKGATTPVKQQGKCGSCYAFSATGAMEGQYFLKTGVLVSLSEQNIIDCSFKYGNFGCDGGFTEYSFQYVIANKGIDTEASYPYKAETGGCRFNNKTIGATFSGYVNLPPGNETILEKAVATVGPVSAGIAASSNFFNYHSGIFSDPYCTGGTINHAVLIVGYGSDPDTLEEYWLVKNSWGELWGEKGYIRMAKNAGNMCSIASLNNYPLV